MCKKLILQKQGQFENHLLVIDVLSGPQKRSVILSKLVQNILISFPFSPLLSAFVVSSSCHFSFHFFFISYPSSFLRKPVIERKNGHGINLNGRPLFTPRTLPDIGILSNWEATSHLLNAVPGRNRRWPRAWNSQTLLSHCCQRTEMRSG